MPDKTQNEKTFVANTILEDVYCGIGASSLIGKKELVVVDDRSNSALAREVQCFPLGCLPLVKKEHLGSAAPGWLFSSRLKRSALSLLVCSVSEGIYRRISDEDIPHIVALINKVAGESSWTPEVRAFLIHSLMAYVTAYRHPGYLQQQDVVVTLPVWLEGQLCFKACCFDADVDFCHGAAVRIFVPLDGKGSPTYLLHGTVFWSKAQGITIADDFNPLGVGEEIRQAARRQLGAVLHAHRDAYGEKVVVLGQSLGGLIATGMAVDFPDMVDKVFAFGPPRPSHYMLRRWESLQGTASLPHINTFFGSFAGKIDPVVLAGDAWIGRVFVVEYEGALDPISRHMLPLAQPLRFSIRELDVAAMNVTGWRQTRLWWLVQRLGASAVYFVLVPFLLMKRALSKMKMPPGRGASKRQR